jgi:hypothetical protein
MARITEALGGDYHDASNVVEILRGIEIDKFK